MSTKLLSIAAVAGLLIGSTAIVHAQSRGMGAGPGASGTSPGHEMQSEGSRGGPGASGFAPGRQGDRDETVGRGDRDDRMGRGDRDERTNGLGRDSDDRMRDDRDDRMMDNDRRGIDKD